MANPTKIIRNYTGITDAEMTQFSHVIHSIFLSEKPQFIGFDPDFNDPFATNWLLAIEAAEAVPSDETMEDELTQLSDAVEEKMELCRHKFQAAKFFIEKAFPKNAALQNEFGYDDYLPSRQVQTKMIPFMENFHRVAEKYKVKLIAKNYTQLMIDEIETFRDELHDANNAQEAFKSGRPVLTQNRIIILNTCWDITLSVCEAGKIIFHNDKAKHDLFLLPGTPALPPLQLFLTLTANQIPLSHLSMGIKGTADQEDDCSISWGDTTTSALTLSGIYQNSAHDYLTEGLYTIEQKSSKPENITGLIGSGGAFNAYAGIQLSPNLTHLQELNFSNSQLTTISIPTELNQLKIVFLVAGNLDAASVNNLLITINGFNTNGGTINISGGTNASPSGQGIAAKNQLISRGWTVTTN